jgi:hypothetical protein
MMLQVRPNIFVVENYIKVVVRKLLFSSIEFVFNFATSIFFLMLELIIFWESMLICSVRLLLGLVCFLICEELIEFDLNFFIVSVGIGVVQIF